MAGQFIGSFICLSTAGAMIASKRRGWLVYGLIALLAIPLLNPMYWSFLVGVGLAAFHSSSRWLSCQLWLSERGMFFGVLSSFLLLFLFGYHEPLSAEPRAYGLYSFLAQYAEQDATLLRVVFHTAAATGIIVLTLSVPILNDLLRRRVALWLGRVSFPVYLVQVPVICGIACAAYTMSLPLGQRVASCLGFFVAVVGSLIVAIPLMKAEAAWLALLRRYPTSASCELAVEQRLWVDNPEQGQQELHCNTANKTQCVSK